MALIKNIPAELNVGPFTEYSGNKTISVNEGDLLVVVGVVKMTFTDATIVQELIIRPSNVGVYGYIVKATSNSVTITQSTSSIMMVSILSES